MKPLTPNLIIQEVTSLGDDWVEKLQKYKKVLPKTFILPVANVDRSLEPEEVIAFKQHKVVTTPYDRFSINSALKQGISKNQEELFEDHKPKIIFSLRTKFIGLYMFLALIFTVALSFIGFSIVTDTIEERFQNNLVEAGKIVAEYMVIEEVNLLETLRIVAHTEGVAEAIERNDVNELRELAYLPVLNAQLETIDLLDEKGENLLSIRHIQGGNVEDYEFISDSFDYSKWNIVQNVINQYQDEIGDKFAGVSDAPWGQYFYISGPVYNPDAEFVGIVLVGKSLGALSKEMREISLAHVSLYDFEGNPLTSTFRSPPTELKAETISSILSQQDQLSFTRSLESIELAYREIIGPWEVRSDVDIGLLGVSLAENFFISTSIPTRIEFLTVMAVALLLVVVMGAYSSRNITRPLTTMTKSSREIADGNYGIRLPISSGDELGVLAFSFNQMISQIQISNDKREQAYDDSLEGWAKALELRDHETEGHSRRVVALTMRLAARFGITGADLIDMRRGALLHDIGKMGIPDEILQKPGPLSDQERIIMRGHPRLAHQLIMNVPYLRSSLDIPYSHHERWDGTGYPDGKRGEEIPLASRIFSVADVWDALLSTRPYRQAWSKREVIDFIWAERGKMFDPQVVDILFDEMKLILPTN